MHESYTLANFSTAEDTCLAVLGDPVGHSLSPQMHQPALDACGIPGRYIRLHVKPDEFPAALRAMQRRGMVGANCTIPHKFAALEAVDAVDPAARRLGAVNTIHFRRDGTTYGQNSDGPGFLRAVEESLGVPVRDLRVLLLGAGGGAGTAVAVQCAMADCAGLVLVNRTQAKAEALCASLSDLPGSRHATVEAWNDENLCDVLARVDLIVNATSRGMAPEDAPLFPYARIDRRHLVYDMIYKPLQTPLVLAAERAGARAINGLPMLLWQGVASFEWWFDRAAPVEAMRAGLERAVQRALL
jgi:shikimate dehydrogenase